MNDDTFNYQTVPFYHQRKAFEHTRDFQWYAFFWEMGLGKSKIIIDTIQHLFVKKEIDSVIITAEKGYYLNWALNEFPTHWPKDKKIRIFSYTSYLTAKNKRAMDEICTPIPGVLDVLIINIESMSGLTMAGSKFAERFRVMHKSTFMCVDESTTIKNPKAHRTKSISAIGYKCQYRRILTGTPITQGPLDLYAQCEFLKRGCLGFGSFTAFKSFYSVMQSIQVGHNRVINQVVGYREMDDLAQRIQPFSSRLLKKDCLDLPEKVYVPIYIEPSPEQIRMLTQLKNEMLAEVAQGLITTENALSVLTKSLQIASGHVKDDDGRVHEIECHKAERLKQLVEDIPVGEKIIVWGYFQHDMEIITKTLSDVCPVFEVSGRVDQKTREENILAFKEHPKKCVFLASPRVAGKSLTLVQAAYSIYYSNGFNLEQRLQSEDRNHRIGQNKTVTYYDLICANTPDVKVVKALKAKEMISVAILSKIEAFFEYDDFTLQTT